MTKMTVKRFEDAGKTCEFYLAQADEAAESARQRVLTPGSGQSLAYEAKYAEAMRVQDGNAGPFPWLDGETQVRGLTRQQMAKLVMANRAKWDALGVAIEVARIEAKEAIKAASTATEMHAALGKLREALDHRLLPG